MRRWARPVRGGREYPTGSRTAAGSRRTARAPGHGQTGVRRARATTAPIAEVPAQAGQDAGNVSAASP
jgi:hypothetical protein